MPHDPGKKLVLFSWSSMNVIMQACHHVCYHESMSPYKHVIQECHHARTSSCIHILPVFCFLRHASLYSKNKFVVTQCQHHTRSSSCKFFINFLVLIYFSNQSYVIYSHSKCRAELKYSSMAARFQYAARDIVLLTLSLFLAADPTVTANVFNMIFYK